MGGLQALSNKKDLFLRFAPVTVDFIGVTPANSFFKKVLQVSK